jgi:hypothetical protein
MISKRRKQVRTMDQSCAATKNSVIIQGTAVRACELRLERRTVAADGTERVEFICGASGGPEHGYVLGLAGEDISSMITTCNACPIPDALEGRRSCLNLVPVRRFSGDKRSLPMAQSQMQAAHSSAPADAYFPCRWFYTLYGQDQPRDTLPCQSCPHWFPRPPLELIPGYWPETRKMLRIVKGEERIPRPPTGFSPAPKSPAARTWWQKLRRYLHL